MILVNIINGEDTKPGEFPWIAKLLYRDDKYCSGDLTIVSVLCTDELLLGTLISGRHVVTAAHCVASEKPLRVRSIKSDCCKIGTYNNFNRLGESNLRTEYDCLGINCNTGYVHESSNRFLA